VPAQLTGKNNLVVENKKISGNSQHANMRRMLSHGTLLLDADLNTLRQVLQSNLEIIQSRAIASIPARVTNIADHLPRPLEMDAFVAELTAGVSKSFGTLEKYRLTTGQWDAVCRLADEKYRSWEWNIGRSPEFTVTHTVKIDGADVDVNLKIKNAVIEAVEVAGDLPVAEMMTSIRANLNGQPYDPCHPDLR
jgi:lipoate-protein ligase A